LGAQAFHFPGISAGANVQSAVNVGEPEWGFDSGTILAEGFEVEKGLVVEKS
jgi:hypothetical protein